MPVIDEGDDEGLVLLLVGSCCMVGVTNISEEEGEPIAWNEFGGGGVTVVILLLMGSRIGGC